MFDKLLIANRGEIACRVIATARRLGIATVAVYSEADAGARHVRLADEAVCIGPAAARESYLDMNRILATVRDTGAQAVHPGYGFLSENADFARACQAAGIVFVGPPVGAIEAMGSKSASKALMDQAGVPLTPGYHGDQQDPAFLAEQAARTGYPVLIKASAGGGGKGMRRVDRPEDFAAALASCQREARNAFGDDRVLIERYVLKPRHIEIQVFGDTQGNVIHLFERDCSVQRRHQKVLEEAPAPGMTAERRRRMGEAAVNAARAVGYVGAGTVEFIVDSSGDFFFMEMNTRLQVEHPVTEMITGLDLVEWQLRVASGEPLPLTQEAVPMRGHALEARLYAEDPDKGFLPSIGRLSVCDLPARADGVRIDAGVEAGDEITPHYDPMIAKLIVHGQDRAQALARMRQALAATRIVGVANNVDFLSRLVATASFAQADLDTALIEREHTALFEGSRTVPGEVWRLASLAWLRDEADTAARAARQCSLPDSPWNSPDGWRANGTLTRTVVLQSGDQTCEVAIEAVKGHGQGQAPGDLAYTLTIGGESMVARLRSGAGNAAASALAAQIGDRWLQASVALDGGRCQLFVDGRSWTVTRANTLQGVSDDEHGGGMVAPMPGKVIALLAAVGAVVEKGTPLIVLEAMKMEHTIQAPAAGTVRGFRYAVGDQVAEGAELVDFEAGAA